jgi:hypothetical protein
MKVVIRLPFTLRFERLNTHGQITPSAFSRSSSALLSLQELLEAVGEREGSPLVVLRRVRVQADDAGFEVDVPPLELQNLARDPPARDIGEPHRWTDGRRQASEDALDLLALEEARPHVAFLQHRDIRHVHQLAVLPRQVKDPLQRRQFAVDLAVRILSLLTLIAIADEHHVLLALQDERIHVGRGDRCEASAAEGRKQMPSNLPFELVGRAAAIHGVFSLEIVRGFVESNPIELGIHRQSVRDISFADLQQLDRVPSFVLPLDSRMGRPFR